MIDALLFALPAPVLAALVLAVPVTVVLAIFEWLRRQPVTDTDRRLSRLDVELDEDALARLRAASPRPRADTVPRSEFVRRLREHGADLDRLTFDRRPL